MSFDSHTPSSTTTTTTRKEVFLDHHRGVLHMYNISVTSPPPLLLLLSQFMIRVTIGEIGFRTIENTKILGVTTLNLYNTILFWIGNRDLSWSCCRTCIKLG
jgi:hypothetical protein